MMYWIFIYLDNKSFVLFFFFCLRIFCHQHQILFISYLFCENWVILEIIMYGVKQWQRKRAVAVFPSYFNLTCCVYVTRNFVVFMCFRLQTSHIIWFIEDKWRITFSWSSWFSIHFLCEVRISGKKLLFFCPQRIIGTWHLGF